MVFGALAWIGTEGGRKLAGNSTPAPTHLPGVSPAPTPTSIAENSSPTPASDGGARTFTDRQFGYEMVVPNKWQVVGLNGGRQGPSEWPLWSALIANVETTSLQSRPEGASFVMSIYRQPMATEDELLAQITEMVTAQPGDVLRIQRGAVIEYYTAKGLANPFGRPLLGRWIWDGKNVLSVVALIYDPNQAEIELIDQTMDSVRLLTP
jgi:hypothetical protein